MNPKSSIPTGWKWCADIHTHTHTNTQAHTAVVCSSCSVSYIYLHVCMCRNDARLYTISYYTYAMRGLAQNEHAGLVYECASTRCAIQTGDDALRLYDMNGAHDEKWTDLLNVFWFFLAYSVIYTHTRIMTLTCIHAHTHTYTPTSVYTCMCV